MYLMALRTYWLEDEVLWGFDSTFSRISEEIKR